MKYWVYKTSRIHGPFDKEAVSGLPGLDSGTLVCADDPAGGSWIPAGELDGLSGIASGGGGLIDDFPSSISLLDQIQIDSSGLVGDDEFTNLFSEELFQDAAFKKGFSDILSDRVSTDESAARQARDKIFELTAKLGALYRQISELEAGQTDIARRLAEKDNELRTRVFAEAAQAKIFLSPAAPPIPGGPPPVAAVQGGALPLMERLVAPAASDSLAPVAAVPLSTEPPVVPAAQDLPTIPSFTSAVMPKATSFGKPKSFKIVPAIKSFKVIGANEAVPTAFSNPVPEFKFEQDPPPVVASDVILTLMPPPVVPSPSVVPALVVPVPIPTMEPAQVPNPFTLPTALMPVVPPQNTLSRSQPVPDLTAPVDDGIAARFAKPEPAPPTVEIEKPRRNNKVFLIAGGVLVTLLVIVGVIFMRQPKDDLKHMATLDDGKAPIGLADDGVASPPPIVKPKIAPELQAPSSPPGPSAEHTTAIGVVKDFPLDGGRGSVGRWLQFSYTANPGAGVEEWNASTTGDNTLLVEYRLVPGAAGGRGALYLFEVDANGIVTGKNIEARQMLAGGPPAEAPKAKKKPAKKVGSQRHAIRETPKEVPLLPLPDSGELRPPAEDGGTFDSDTVNSGI